MKKNNTKKNNTKKNNTKKNNTKKNNTKKNKIKDNFFFNPSNPKKSFDVYIDKNPNDTIHIKYTSINDVKNTIKKLEKLYKSNKYSHKRIWQVAMIMKVRLGTIYKYKDSKYKNAILITERYNLAKKYLKFLSDRSDIKNVKDRKEMVFKV